MWNINIADLVSISATIVIFIWFLFVRKKQYLDNYLIGKYHIFDSYRNHPDTTALYTLEIYKVFETGWFSGKLSFTEPSKPIGSRSEGEICFIGNVKYGFVDSLKSLFSNTTYSVPLEVKSNQNIKGKLYLLMRNDIDISKSDWKEFITYIYDIQHLPQSGRLKINISEIKSDMFPLLPDQLNLVNTDLFPDNMFNF